MWSRGHGVRNSDPTQLNSPRRSETWPLTPSINMHRLLLQLSSKRSNHKSPFTGQVLRNHLSTWLTVRNIYLYVYLYMFFHHLYIYIYIYIYLLFPSLASSVWSHERFILRNRSSSDDDVIVAGAWRVGATSKYGIFYYPFCKKTSYTRSNEMQDLKKHSCLVYSFIH